MSAREPQLTATGTAEVFVFHDSTDYAVFMVYRMAELCTVAEEGFGIAIVCGRGLYGRQGLSGEEYAELYGLKVFLSGVEFASPGATAIVSAEIEAIVAARKASVEASREVADG